MVKFSQLRIWSVIILILCAAVLSPASAAPLQSVEGATSALDLLLEHDDAVSVLINQLSARNLITVPPDQFKTLLTDSLLDMTSQEIPEIAPGCLLPYTIATTTLLTYTPTMFILFLNELTNGDEECALMYGSWSIAGICFALASWTQYRICAELNADTPDQNTIARLQNDLTTMEIGALAAAGSALVFRTNCSSSSFKLTGLGRKKKR